MATTYHPMPQSTPPTAGATVPPQAGVTIIQPTPAVQKPKKKEKYARQLYGFGIAEIILGALCLLLAVAAILLLSTSYYSMYSVVFTYMSQGIWCGIFPIISGILGIVAKKKPTNCMYNANMAMTIVSAVMLALLFSLSILAMIMSSGGVLACHIIISIISFVCLIITIVHSAYCCAGVCNDPHSYQGQVIYPAQGQQFVQLANGQYMLVHGQPTIVGQPLVSVSNVGMPIQQPAMYPSTSVMTGSVQPLLQEPTKQPGGPGDEFHQPGTSGPLPNYQP